MYDIITPIKRILGLAQPDKEEIEKLNLDRMNDDTKMIILEMRQSIYEQRIRELERGIHNILGITVLTLSIVVLYLIFG